MGADDEHRRNGRRPARFIDERGLTHASIIGHSLGGKTAMLTALRNAAMVEALVVVDIAPVRYRHSFLAGLEALQGLDLTRLHRRAKRKRRWQHRSPIRRSASSSFKIWRPVRRGWSGLNLQRSSRRCRS